MIINSYSDFEKQVKEKGLSGGIIVCGQEKQLIDKTVGRIYSLIDMLPDMNITRLSGESISQDEVFNACETFPVMASKRLVHIKNAEFLLKGKKKKQSEDKDEAEDKEETAEKDEKDDGEQGIGKFIADYIPHIPDYTILLMTYNGKINDRCKAAAAVKSAGVYVFYQTLRKDMLYKWIEREFDEQGKSITKSDIYYLTSIAGYNTEQLEMEIEKLVCYCKDEKLITRKHIEAVVHRSLEDNIFKMVDSITTRNADAALSILNVLLTEKEKPLKILAMINRQFRLLLMAKGCMQENLSPDEIKSRLKLNMFDNAFKNFLIQARNSQEGVLRGALNKCLETDCSMKNGTYGSDGNDMALEMLIIELCK